MTACEHTRDTKDFPTTGGSARTSRPKRRRIRHPKFAIGERVRFADGTFTGTGVVDAVTGDYAIIWLWIDGGTGRRMFLQGSGTIVEPIASPESTPSGHRCDPRLRRSHRMVREREDTPTLAV